LKPLSVLHLGAGRYAPSDRHHSTLDIWRELARGADRYTVFARSTEAKWSSFQEGNLTVHLAPSRTSRELEFLLTQFHALRLAREVQPDVVVSQCPVAGGLAAERIARQTGAKMLVELHMSGYVEPAPLIGQWRFRQALTRRTLERATRIRVLSEGMRDRLLEFYGASLDKKVVVLPPRVDLRRFRNQREDRVVGGRLRVAIVGSITARKRQLAYLETVLGSSLDVETWIIGDGPQRQACEALVAQHRAEDRVRFVGNISHDELAPMLSQVDALVLYSEMEGTPRAIMEGMAMSLPVITTDAGFCADMVSDAVEGFVIDRYRPDELLDRLARLHADETMRSQMGRAARVRAKRDYDSATLFNRYRELVAETAAA